VVNTGKCVFPTTPSQLCRLCERVTAIYLSSCWSYCESFNYDIYLSIARLYKHNIGVTIFGVRVTVSFSECTSGALLLHDLLYLTELRGNYRIPLLQNCSTTVRCHQFSEYCSICFEVIYSFSSTLKSKCHKAVPDGWFLILNICWPQVRTLF
jgi:hypothetical protein